MKFVSVLDCISKYLFWTACGLLILVVLVVTGDVLLRYFVTRTITWTGEFVTNSLLFICFLGAAWVLREEGHVTIDLVIARLKPESQATINMITSILCAIICLIIVWSGIEVVWDEFQRGAYFPTLHRPPVAPIHAIIPVGTFLLAIQFLRRAHKYLVKR